MKHFETQIKDFTQQFADQVKCLDAKVTVDNNILGNILDIYKRRASIEQEYADNLLKLTTIINQRNNVDYQKKSKWKNYSPATLLNSLLASTQYTAKAHRHLADIYGKQITQRIIDMQDDCVRLNKKSTDILQKHQLEIITSLNRLLLKQKVYIKTFNEADEARKRADRAMEQLDREVVRCQDKKKDLDKNPRIKRLKEDYMEKYGQFQTKQAESTGARNKYIIHLVSLKETIAYFYSNELKTIIECAEYGFHNNLTRLSMNHTSCEDALITVHESINKLFTDSIEKIDANSDTQAFMDAHKSILTMKENLHFCPAKDDNVNQILKSKESVQNNLQNLFIQFDTEMNSITKKVDEDKVIIDSLSRTLNDLINQNDYDVFDYICHQSQSDTASIKERSTSLPRNGVSECSYTSIQKTVKADKMKTELKYFGAMELYLANQINKVNMGTKLKNVDSALSSDNDDMESQRWKCGFKDIQTITAVIIGMKSKLFGGDLTKYCRETNEMVPVVVQSCIRLINLYGMRNIGVFRVPGSQTDVQTYKLQFEHGNDPLKQLIGAPNDVNLAASILKLYFRELYPPIFDENMFDKIVHNYNTVKRNEEAVVDFLKELVLLLSPPVYATLNYVLSFISHLAEFSAENCMDILNLAIIFGPCLMPIPEEKSSQLFQYQSIVNHVAQCLITHHKSIFTKVTGGPVYQRDQNNLQPVKHSNHETRTSSELDNSKLHLSLTSTPEEDSEKHFEISAVAVSDYEAKSDQELSYNKGDTFLLKKKVNEHWWIGHLVKLPDQLIQTNTGLIANEFISVCSSNEVSSVLDLLKQKGFDLSSLENQRSSNKNITLSHKISLGSIDSDNDLSPDDNRSLSQSLENPTESELGECKSFGSLENIIDDDEDDNMLIKSAINLESDKSSPTSKTVEDNDSQHGSSNIVKMRESRSSIAISPDTISTETAESLDEDLEKTILGLKKIEELNVIRHRSTVHIDKNMLSRKFISPLNSDHMTIFDLKNEAITRPQSTDRPRNFTQEAPIDFKVRKPGSIASLTSTFEMNLIPRPFTTKPCDRTNSLNRTRNAANFGEITSNTPPPTFPKPKMTKK